MRSAEVLFPRCHGEPSWSRQGKKLFADGGAPSRWFANNIWFATRMPACHAPFNPLEPVIPEAEQQSNSFKIEVLK
jgi:hypothetical protein